MYLCRDVIIPCRPHLGYWYGYGYPIVRAKPMGQLERTTINNTLTCVVCGSV